MSPHPGSKVSLPCPAPPLHLTPSSPEEVEVDGGELVLDKCPKGPKEVGGLEIDQGCHRARPGLQSQGMQSLGRNRARTLAEREVRLSRMWPWTSIWSGASQRYWEGTLLRPWCLATKGVAGPGDSRAFRETPSLTKGHKSTVAPSPPRGISGGLPPR